MTTYPEIISNLELASIGLNRQPCEAGRCLTKSPSWPATPEALCLDCTVYWHTNEALVLARRLAVAEQVGSE